MNAHTQETEIFGAEIEIIRTENFGYYYRITTEGTTYRSGEFGTASECRRVLVKNWFA